MNTKITLSLFTSIVLFNPLLLPVFAQSNQPINSNPAEVKSENNSHSSEVNVSLNSQPIEISQDTAIIISFPAPVTVDAGQKKEYPLTLPLSSAIKDDQGNIIIPENTPVTVVLKSQEGGMKIIAQSLIINGKIVKIDASSAVIPGTTITHKRANDKAVENGAIWGRIGGSTMGFLGGGDPDRFDRGAMLGSAVGLLSGLRSPENTRIVQIPQSSVYVLSLSAPIRVSR